jgi:hypothetical protein
MRAVAYIDGMNFYEASKDKQWYPAGWCNWMETIATYAPSATGVSVKYSPRCTRAGTELERVGRNCTYWPWSRWRKRTSSTGLVGSAT